MRYLVATNSVHTTAAACDYLDPRLDADDEVTVLAVREEEVKGAARDAGDAANVAVARLTGRAEVTTEVREGDPAEAILATVEATDPDVLILGPRSGAPGATGTDADLGSTARAVLVAAGVPAVVVPLQTLD